ncbi:hypothetical protein QAD02_003317 [Eretmocerus hayati]|uniref:Uncharacterized protein n=1 Tax=Eretmocerus hayati TaxID=131215 RepID=A0ACC2NMF6_9HYME|nr:hypothetical protein QAD02_003317 [Eretmocerus hayati]
MMLPNFVTDSDGQPDDLLTVASGTLCNLLLEFSPSKEPILELGGVDLLCSLTRRSDPALRLNGIWALMNVAFQAEQRVKSQILTSLGTDQIFRLLADSELPILMKTLGLLRNLLSTKTHIDRIMTDHSAHVMQAVILVLENPMHPAEVKEQALCILANVADGDKARDHIMANEDVLKKLTDYMVNPIEYVHKIVHHDPMTSCLSLLFLSKSSLLDSQNSSILLVGELADSGVPAHA